MRERGGLRRACMIVLCAGIALAIVLFGFAANYSPGVHIGLAIGLIGLLSAAAWIVGASALIGAGEQPRLLSTAGVLLIAPPLLFVLLAGYGRPDQATLAENYFRYVVLFISITAIGIGMIVLKEAANAAGERFFSTLGFAAIILASSLYLIWVSIILAYLTQKLGGGTVAPVFRTLLEISELWLFFGGALTYLSTAAFIAAMARVRWVGPFTASALATFTLVALLLLSIRGFAFPDPREALQHWYTALGWIAGIPAVPWLVPNVLGVVLLWHAGDHPQSEPATNR